MAAAFRHFEGRTDLKYNLVYAPTAEEEISGLNGIEALLPHFQESGIPSIDCALVGEPTGMQMAVAEKGLLVLDCTMIGKSGHAARDEGDLITSSSIAFGDTYAGTANERTLTIDNDGLGALNLQSATIAGPAAGRFAVAVNETLPIDIEAAGSFDLRVVYTAPSVPTGNIDTATLTLRSDDPDDDPVTVELSGSAVRPVSPACHWLGEGGGVSEIALRPHRGCVAQVRSCAYG
jgi:acetylornithine deacetylase/succinyl-diaminopimelate desuccinylase-like protein